MSGEVLPPDRIDELERALGRIAAVGAARAVLGLSGEITEVHVVATEERSPKLIVRDVQSVARAMFNVDVDYRKISVVHLPAPAPTSVPDAVPVPDIAPVAAVVAEAAALETEAAPAETQVAPADSEPDLVVLDQPVADDAASRLVRSMHVEPAVARVVISQSGALTEVAVHLAGAGTEGSASVRGPSSQVAMLAARAALAARETLGADDAATVAGVEESVVGGRRVVIVAAIVAGAAGEAFATACAPVTGSVAEAAAAAALQAVAGRAG